MQQICWDLLSNAVKFTAPGGRVDVRVRHEGQYAEVEVSDTGEGIATELLARVFEPLRQGSGATANGGLGLGLAIVRQLVTMHRGTVDAESDGAGKGSRFVVRMPVTTAAGASEHRFRTYRDVFSNVPIQRKAKKTDTILD